MSDPEAKELFLKLPYLNKNWSKFLIFQANNSEIYKIKALNNEVKFHKLSSCNLTSFEQFFLLRIPSAPQPIIDVNKVEDLKIKSSRGEDKVFQDNPH